MQGPPQGWVPPYQEEEEFPEFYGMKTPRLPAPRWALVLIYSALGLSLLVYWFFLFTETPVRHFRWRLEDLLILIIPSVGVIISIILLAVRVQAGYIVTCLGNMTIFVIWAYAVADTFFRSISYQDSYSVERMFESEEFWMITAIVFVGLVSVILLQLRKVRGHWNVHRITQGIVLGLGIAALLIAIAGAWMDRFM